MSRPAAKPIAQQEELALSSVAAHAIFPGRRILYVRELCEALAISDQQVIDLIVAGDLVAIDISARRAAEDAGKTSMKMTPEERRAVRRTHWRIPVSAYAQFLADRSSLNTDAA